MKALCANLTQTNNEEELRGVYTASYEYTDIYISNRVNTCTKYQTRYGAKLKVLCHGQITCYVIYRIM